MSEKKEKKREKDDSFSKIFTKDTLKETVRVHEVTQDPVPKEFRSVTERKSKKEE